MINNDLLSLIKQMSVQTDYDEAWLMGLEIQSLEASSDTIDAFRQVLIAGSMPARRAAAFWLADDAEHAPVDLLLQMATDADKEIRFHAAYCLSYSRHDRVVPTLVELALHDEDDEVRQTAVQSLYDAAYLNLVPDHEILKHLTAVYKQDVCAKVREEVVISLANFLKSSVLLEAIQLLEEALSDLDAAVRDQAAISLSVLRDEIWHIEDDDPVLLMKEL